MENLEGRNKKNRFKPEVKYYVIICLSVIFIFGGFYIYIKQWQKTNKTDDRVVIRIFPQNEQQIQQLNKMKFISKGLNNDDFFEVEGRFRDVLEINNLGIPAAIVIESEQHATIDTAYPTYHHILAEIQSLVDAYPTILYLEEIGKSQFNKLPIFGVKISKSPNKREDEPSVLFMAGHHAREAAGIQVCLEIIRYLVKNQKEPEVDRWLSNFAIWVVPCLNPDGYDYVVSNHLKFPWWRKNLRDNNNNGLFEPEIDGVDLNRNYDFNWNKGGSDDSTTWYFRGISSNSESEIKAIVKLAERERFILTIDYHSFGEAVLYPWSNEMKPPDYHLISGLSEKLANQLSRYDSKRKYKTIPLNGKSGQSANWFYAKFRAISFIVEVGPEYFPTSEMLNEIVSSQLNGVKFLLNRVLKSGISGQIIDEDNLKPLEAIIQLDFDFSPIVEPTKTDPQFGRFRRLLLPGKYTITASALGYQEKKLAPILVNDNQIQKIQITLKKLVADE